MARRIRVAAGVLNIRLHPHPDGIYNRFINALFDLRKPIQLRSDRYGMISLLSRREEGSGIFTGLIATFTKIDISQPWFNAANLKEASNNEVSEISIPNGLFPNSSSFNFVFDANKHRLFVQTYSKGKSISVDMARKLFQSLSSDLSIVKEFGDATIDIVQSKVGLETIFSLPVIKRLTITISKPNADVFDDDFDEKIEDFLQELQSKKMTVIVDAEPGKTIKPNQSIRRIAESALDHGKVKAEGRDTDGSTERSTESYPEILHDRYDPDLQSESDAFRKMTGR